MSETDDAAQVEALIEEFQRSGLREFHVRTGSFELYLSKEAGAEGIVRTAVAASDREAAKPSSAPARPQPADHARPGEAAPALPEGTTPVTAPYLGTFYRAPKPGAPVYVNVGDRVEPEAELCLVEVMKLFTAVRAGVAGTVAAILANDGQLVEAGQPLFAIRTD